MLPIATPLGEMIAIADGEGLLLLEFGDSWLAHADALRGRFGEPIEAGRTPIHSQLEDELASYFAGSSAPFRTPIAPRGTPFQQRVWRELRRIPRGQTRSYGAIARTLGNAQSVRAVGRANALNPVAIVISCHRVVAGDGSLCGYAGGPWRKQRLLELEGAPCASQLGLGNTELAALAPS
jgi:AraC family transcriptional regulator of adaptative response/methylated-DNA-[protein]-cysteine methyltransferase